MSSNGVGCSLDLKKKLYGSSGSSKFINGVPLIWSFARDRLLLALLGVVVTGVFPRPSFVIRRRFTEEVGVSASMPERRLRDETRLLAEVTIPEEKFEGGVNGGLGSF